MLIKLVFLVLLTWLSFVRANKLGYGPRICEVIAKSSIYDCSNLLLQWEDLETSLIEPTRTATSLSLASNNFSSIITNKTFNIFKLLDHTLNLSSNRLEKIESHGFFYNPDFRNPYSQLKTLRIRILDLSHNSFEVIPWNSINLLWTLEKIYFNGNTKLTVLDRGDLAVTLNMSFMSLTHLYFSSCSIELVKPDILKEFKSLKFLDLSGNNLRNINQKVGSVLYSLGGVDLRLGQNKLECSCHLLWLKKYLIKFGLNDTRCLINKPINIDSVPILVKQIPVNLVSNPNDMVLNSSMSSMSNLSQASNDTASVINLDDSKFMCEINFREPSKWFQVKDRDDRYEIVLKCLVQGYPLPSIRWNENNKSLDKKSTYKTFSIKEREIKTEGHLKTIESTLKFFLVVPIRPSLNGYRNYSCRAMLGSGLKKPKDPSTNEIETDSIQKMVDFKVYHGVDLAYSGWFSNDFSNTESSEVTLRNIYHSEKSDELEAAYIRSRQRPFIYWIILMVCLLFALMIVLFATYCIIHNNHKSAKMREELRFLGHSSYSVNKRSAIYLSSSTANTKHSSAVMSHDKSVLSPLKPDNIREHQEYISIYFNDNQNDQTPYSDSVHYSNLNDSPSSLLLNGATEITYTQSDQRDRSADSDNLQSSPVDSDDEAKSFEENISEYQDPEFDDLRKPDQRIEK